MEQTKLTITDLEGWNQGDYFFPTMSKDQQKEHLEAYYRKVDKELKGSLASKDFIERLKFQKGWDLRKYEKYYWETEPEPKPNQD